MKLLAIFDKLERLVHRLPEALQQPILREITPIKTLFLLQRPPRIVLAGDRAFPKAQLLAALFGEEVARPGDELLNDGRWQSLSRSGHGTLRLLDAREPVSLAAAHEALAAEPPDLVLIARASDSASDLAASVEHAGKVVAFTKSRGAEALRVVGLVATSEESSRIALHAALHSHPAIESRMAGTLALGEDPADAERLVQFLGTELPPETQLEMARLSRNRVLQTQIAQVVVKSISAICAAVGAQPIPLADFPILTSLQAAMVAGIMHISGREMSLKLAGEFLAALGANIGAGLALREGARAAVKLIPLWGNAVSGAVAAAGTYGIGRAATAYFIEGHTLADARKALKQRRLRGSKDAT